MERKLSDRSWPPLPPREDSPKTESAGSTPDAAPAPAADSKGAIPKSKSMGKLESIRSSLREVGRGSSFKLGKKKQIDEEGGVKEKEKKKTKKLKKDASTGKTEAVTAPLPKQKSTTEAAGALSKGKAATLPATAVSASNESLTSKVSKASKLVRKLSIGRYRGKGDRKDKDEAPARGALSPELSRADFSEDEVRSVGSSASEGRQGPEGDEGELATPTHASASAPSSAPPTPPQPPPRGTTPPPPPPLGQSRLIGGAANKGLAAQPQPTPSFTAAAAAATATPGGPGAGPLLHLRQSQDGGASRKDRDPALATVPEALGHEEAPAAAERQETRSSSTAASPALQQTSLAGAAEAAPPRSPPPSPQRQRTPPPPRKPEEAGSRPADSAAFMSQRQSSAPAAAAPVAAPSADAASTKSQILSITTPAIKKQQQALEAAAAAAAAAAAGHNSTAASPTEPKPSTSSAPPPVPTSAPPPLEDPEDEQFGDVEDADADSFAARNVMSAPPPSAATVMAEARARLSQSLGGSTETPTQPVNEKREHLYKILVIGELGTGKTSIIKRYVHQFFSQHYRATIGVDFALKVLNWDANTVIRLQLWDIAGQERFGNMTRVYYKEAVGAFIVFDVTRAATFDAVIKWKQDLDAKVQLFDGSPIPCVLLANKCDQQKEGIVNNATKMDEYCKERGFSAWFETSAKENINIEEAARCLVTKILQNDKLIYNENGRDNDKFALDGKAQGDEKSGKSCAC